MSPIRWATISGPLLGGVVGAAFFLWIAGAAIVNPTRIGWLMRLDWQWHFLGWHLFRAEPWHMPPGAIAGLFHPVGTSVAYTDSIPVLAFAFKPFDAVLPRDFQYIGAWLLACFTLQGVFGALLVRALTPRALLQALGAGLFVLSPILLNRVGHAALTAHWLILAALWLYVRPLDARRSGLATWTIVVAIAAATHPYLAVMVLGLALAFAARLCEKGVGSGYPFFARAAGRVGLLVVVALAVWWAAGYFLVDDAQSLGERGVGEYAMNLLAPITTSGWSGLLPDLPLATPGQTFEAFNYLGAGALLLAAWALSDVGRHGVDPARLRMALPLVVVCAAFALVAVSPTLTAGRLVLIDLSDALERPLGFFRVTGRFFWPVSYVLVFGAIAVVIRGGGSRRPAVILAAALAVQAVDLHARHQSIRRARMDSAWLRWQNPLRSPFWDNALPHYRHLALVPPAACGEGAAPYAPFAYLAGAHRVTINTGYAARIDHEKMARYCEALRQDVQQGNVSDDTLYVVSDGEIERFKKTAREPMVCGRVDGFNACATPASVARWCHP